MIRFDLVNIETYLSIFFLTKTTETQKTFTLPNYPSTFNHSRCTTTLPQPFMGSGLFFSWPDVIFNSNCVPLVAKTSRTELSLSVI